eukprot:scaffold6441_cov76-Phaeocystis_antarctica.AAC.4
MVHDARFGARVGPSKCASTQGPPRHSNRRHDGHGAQICSSGRSLVTTSYLRPRRASSVSTSRRQARPLSETMPKTSSVRPGLALPAAAGSRARRCRVGAARGVLTCLPECDHQRRQQRSRESTAIHVLAGEAASLANDAVCHEQCGPEAFCSEAGVSLACCCPHWKACWLNSAITESTGFTDCATNVN